MGPQDDAHAEVVHSDNLHQAGVLSVAEAHATQLTGHLQTKGPQLLEALHSGLLHSLQHVILGRIVHLLKETGHGPHQLLENLCLVLVEHRRIWKHLIRGELAFEHAHSKGFGFRLDPFSLVEASEERASGLVWAAPWA